MKPDLTVDPAEIQKFALLAETWWDKDGSLKTLHDINPCRLAFIASFMALESQRILDVGCGGGILTEALTEAGAQATGLDVDPRIIAVAKAHAGSRDLTTEYICTPIESFEETAFDAVTCMEMLEHASDPAAVIRHCARCLKPGGLLFLSTINRSLKAYLTVVLAAEYVLQLMPKQTHDYQKFIKPSELAAMVRASGFEVLDVQGMGYNPFSRIGELTTSVAANYLMCCRLSV